MIYLDRVGVVTTEENDSFQIKISSAELGKGYFLYICNDFSNSNENIGDHYFDSPKDIEESFKEDNWYINWV